MNIELLSDDEIYEKFKNYLVAFGYKEFTPKGQKSTAYDYPTRISYIVWYENYDCCIDVVKNIKGLLKEYDIGGQREEIGQKSHAAVINALKRFDEFLVYAQNHMNIYSSHLIRDDYNIDLISKENKIEFTDKVNIKKTYKLFTLVMNDEYGESIENFYISSEIKDIDATKISEDTLLAKELVNKKLGDSFKINETEYTIEKIQDMEE